MNSSFDIETIYYINPLHFQHRTTDIENVVNTLQPKYKERITDDFGDNKKDKACMAHIRTMDRIIENKTYPALILEDDAAFIKTDWKYNDTFDEDVDVVYLGGSLYPSINHLRLSEYNEKYYRVEGMLAQHAYILTNETSTKKIQEIMRATIGTTVYGDQAVASASKDLLFIAPKDGMYFYQNDNLTRDVTRFTWDSCGIQLEKEEHLL